MRIILDNHSAHTSKETRHYLATVPNRFEFVFTPTHGSWLRPACRVKSSSPPPARTGRIRNRSNAKLLPDGSQVDGDAAEQRQRGQGRNQHNRTPAGVEQRRGPEISEMKGFAVRGLLQP